MKVASGRKIIVTIRSHEVASITSAFGKYEFKGLLYDECMLLFVKSAFKEGDGRNYPELVKIGEDIVKKCKGVPLAVGALGSLLFYEN